MTIGWGGEGKERDPRLWMIVAGVLLLTACDGSTQGNGVPDAAVTATEQTVAPASRLTAAELLGVIWTTAVDPETRAPVNEVSSFPTNAPTIIAAVEIGEAQAGTVLTATWSIDGVDVPQATMQVTAGKDLKEGWATFQFNRAPDRLFPLGELQVRVSAGDDSVVTGTVDIVLPEPEPEQTP